MCSRPGPAGEIFKLANSAMPGMWGFDNPVRRDFFTDRVWPARGNTRGLTNNKNFTGQVLRRVLIGYTRRSNVAFWGCFENCRVQSNSTGQPIRDAAFKFGLCPHLRRRHNLAKNHTSIPQQNSTEPATARMPNAPSTS